VKMYGNFGFTKRFLTGNVRVGHESWAP